MAVKEKIMLAILKNIFISVMGPVRVPSLLWNQKYKQECGLQNIIRLNVGNIYWKNLEPRIFSNGNSTYNKHIDNIPNFYLKN